MDLSGSPCPPRPSVTIHYAQTLDGRIATRTRSSQWISGDASLRFAHELRAGHDAVMVGVGTVAADNPRLTVRLVPGRSPLRVVADSALNLPCDANLLLDRTARTLVATTDRAPAERIAALERAGVEVLLVGRDAYDRVDLRDLLGCLAERGVRSLLIEGGGAVITSALRERLVDRLIVCIAPKVLGAGIDAVGDLNIMHLADALTFAGARFTPLGQDVIFDGTLDRAAADDGTRWEPHRDGTDGDRSVVPATAAG